MQEFFQKLFFTDFMPHVYCLREPGLVKLHAFSDAVIASSYFGIPAALFVFVRQRRDLLYSWMFLLFGVFILGCGLTHLLAVVTLWHPVYRLEGVVKALTAIASFGTGILLCRTVPGALNLPGSQQLLAAIVESSDDAILSHDLNGMITSWNSGAERLYGYSAAEAIGKSVAILSPVEGRDDLARTIERIRAGERIRKEAVRQTKDRRAIVVALTISPVRAPSGAILGVSKTAHDITAQKLAQEQLKRIASELRDSEERFRTMAETVPNLLWATSAAGSATYVGRRYQEYSGLSSEELQGEGWLQVLHPDDHERVGATWAEALREGQSYELEYRLRRFDGSYRWFVARAIPLRNAEGQILEWFGSSTDIHELKRSQEALRRSNEELRQFAYAAAHDLQEPLRNISNSMGMLRRAYRQSTNEGAMHWVEISEEGAQRMHKMVKDLLTYSSIVDEDELPNALVDASEAVAKAIENLGSMVRESGAELIPGPLPRICGHEHHLIQLFQNLIGNSIKYRRPDVRPVVRIFAEHRADEWTFTVADNGIGFDRAYTDRIFKVFKRLHGRREYSGNGIGLAICARIVAHYGGRIWGDGVPGEGATFSFTLPEKPSAI
ncbi:MAG: PAS domain S-box protein [Acidobacteriaceae bacterium]|nr:PAS domain S-box protein [Acidobacteriaceae bacterium]